VTSRKLPSRQGSFFFKQDKLVKGISEGTKMTLDENRIFRLAQQTVVLDDFPAEGWILDIGGGGEAVIGQLKTTQVVAIDIFPRELAEAPAGPLKIVMDARELKFLDCTFSTVTAFFGFMFIHPDDHEKVLGEIFRVLAPKGQFMLWDVDIRQRPEPERDMMVLHLQVKLPSSVINTGYGTPYTEKCLTLHDYIVQANKIGFKWIKQGFAGQTFFCKFQKP
jgi:ubiquinone/menaquinone biosynthesis C-methylase UbiE